MRTQKKKTQKKNQNAKKRQRAQKSEVAKTQKKKRRRILFRTQTHKNKKRRRKFLENDVNLAVMSTVCKNYFFPTKILTFDWQYVQKRLFFASANCKEKILCQ